MTRTPLDIAIVDDEQVIRESLRDFLVKQGEHIREYANGASALSAFASNPPDLVVLDIRMPGEDGLAVLRILHAQYPELAVIMMSGHATMESIIEAMRAGAADFLRKPVRLPELLTALERTRRLMHSERERNRLRATLARAQLQADDGKNVGYLGSSSACGEVLQFLKAAERTPFDGVLITGETGTGKEVIARELHRRLRGMDAPFVVVNCPALPENLVESELFGHMKGAFTGADQDKPGAFELASGGTLFLDELGDLAVAAQAKLLRTLESRQLRRLGGQRELTIDVTVIAATNQNLESLVHSGAFRRDLLYRLNIYQLRLPALRERVSDIPELAQHFLIFFSARRHLPTPRLTPEAVAALQAYDFPGNVRELRNLLERAVMLCEHGVIDVRDLGLHVHGGIAGKPICREVDRSGLLERAAHMAVSSVAGQVSQSSMQMQMTMLALQRHRWNRRKAAQDLGISYEALRWFITKNELSANHRFGQP